VAERSELLLREVKRATRLTNGFLSGQVLVGLIAAFIGAVSGAFVSHLLVQSWSDDVSAVIGATAGPIFLGVGAFWFFFLTYRFGGFHDADWTATHDDSAPRYLLLKLVSETGVDMSLVIEIRVWCHDQWIVVPFEDLPPLRAHNRWIEYEFSREHRHQLYPGGTYEVRWFGRDRGKFVEITREQFELKDHSTGVLTGSESLSG
jgi:hypothetical protein